ncbi:MAG TPA: hypothetical protein VH539_24205 [Gemmatimonadaceae bacterium]|jgi:hypothetical protein
MQPTDFTGPPSEGPLPDTSDTPRAPYTTPRLEPLGTWRARTLQQSVPLTGFRGGVETDPGARYGES